MALTSLNDIKNWFKTNLIPTQQQFYDMFDSFRHKSDKVAATDIDGLTTLLAAKASDEAFVSHTGAENAHAGLFGALRTWVGEQILGATVESTLLGSITPSSTIPATINVHGFAAAAGTYANCGGMVVPVNSIAFLSRVGGAWTVSATTFSLTEYAKIVDVNKINPWQAIPYVLGSQVNKAGIDWYLPTSPALSTDIPGVSSKWAKRLKQVSLEAGKNLLDKNALTVNTYINGSTGVATSNSSFSSSDYIKVNPLTNYFYSGGNSRYWAFYDDFGTYISGNNGAGGDILIATPALTTYIRVTIDNLYVNTAQLTLGSTVPGEYTPYKLEIPFSERGFEIKNNNLFDLNTAIDGYGIDGTGNIGAFVNHKLSAPISVSALAAYTIIGMPNNLKVVQFQNSSNVKIGYASSAVFPFTFITPANTAFIQFTCKSSSDTPYVPTNIKVVKGGEYQEYLNPSKDYPYNVKVLDNNDLFKSKKCLLEGDSITRGYNAGIESTTYSDLIKYKFGFNAVVQKGLTAGTLACNPSWGTQILSDARLSAIVTEAPDYLILMGGVNDYQVDVPFGTISSDRTTTAGSLAYAIQYLKTNLKNLKIIFCSSTPYYYKPNFMPSVQSGRLPNTLGFNLRQYINACELVCKEYSVPFIDLYMLSNWLDLNETGATKVYTTDGLHLSFKGYDLVTTIQKNVIKNIIAP